MSYINKLSKSQFENIAVLISSFNQWGISNIYSQAAILAIVSKESNFNYKFEIGYGNTSNSRIRRTFGKRVSHLSEDELSILKKDDRAFFNLVYGNRYGNGSDDGYKYRGGGPNQLTFKENYKKTGKHIGVDLVDKPELVNDPYVSADIACSYFVRRFRSFSKSHQEKYSSTDINGFTSLNDACFAMYHANAGLGKSFSYIERKMKSGGGKKTLDRAPELLQMVRAENMPFNTKADGDKFRAWVNDNHSDVARDIDLDRSGSHTNRYILQAWSLLGNKYLDDVRENR